MAARVFITGYGIISALGKGVSENLTSLRQGQTGIAHPQHLATVHKQALVTGEVKYSNRELAGLADYSFSKYTSRTALLALIAAQEAVAVAGLTESELKSSGLINGTSVGGMDISEHYYQELQQEEAPVQHNGAFMGHDCGSITEIMAAQLGVRGHISTISTACSSSANSIMQGGRLIRAGKLERAIVGGTDALSVFTLNGFSALKILDPALCRPFDVTRAGLNLGEGAAYLVLESEAQVAKRGTKVLAELIGWGNANDAYHQTASSPEGKGAYLAMKKALEMSGRERTAVDYINAHGTGTANNDLSESTALNAMFGEALPAYSSTKAYTGHTLGAAGAIEAVFSVLALQYGIKYPNLRLEQHMDVAARKPLTSFTEGLSVTCVLSNSFGFGGNCSSLLFAK